MDWRAVKRLQETPFFHYSPIVVIGVPLLAQLYLSVHPHIPHLAFPRVLVVGFTAGVLFIFSYILYHHYCPEAVKDFADERAFANANQKIFETAEQHQKLQIVLANLEASEEDIRSKLQYLKESQKDRELNEELNQLYPMAIQRYLMNTYIRDSYYKSRKNMWASTVLYWLGFFLALVIMIERVVAVYRAAI